MNNHEPTLPDYARPDDGLFVLGWLCVVAAFVLDTFPMPGVTA